MVHVLRQVCVLDMNYAIPCRIKDHQLRQFVLAIAKDSILGFNFDKEVKAFQRTQCSFRLFVHAITFWSHEVS